MALARRIALVVLVVAAGCSSATATAVAHRLQIGTTNFALAEVTRRVGLNRVVVSAQGGIAPPVGNAAWTDPVAMEGVTEQVAGFLIEHDPAGRAAYQAAARAYQAQLGALDIDYRSSLSDCARHDIVTADLALAPVAARYNFVDHTAGDPGIAAVVHSKGIPVLFTETGTPSDGVLALAQATHARVDVLDTMTARTPDEATRGATYLSLATDNLVKLRSALACSAPD